MIARTFTHGVTVLVEGRRRMISLHETSWEACLQLGRTRVSQRWRLADAQIVPIEPPLLVIPACKPELELFL